MSVFCCLYMSRLWPQVCSNSSVIFFILLEEVLESSQYCVSNTLILIILKSLLTLTGVFCHGLITMTKEVVQSWQVKQISRRMREISTSLDLYTPTKSWEEVRSGTISENICVVGDGLKRIHLQVTFDLKEFICKLTWLLLLRNAAGLSLMISLQYTCAECLLTSLNTHIHMEICKQPEDLCLLSESIQYCNKSKWPFWKYFPADGFMPNRIWLLLWPEIGCLLFVRYPGELGHDFSCLVGHNEVRMIWKSRNHMNICFIMPFSCDLDCSGITGIYRESSAVSLLSDQHIQTKNFLFSLIYCVT